MKENRRTHTRDGRDRRWSAIQMETHRLLSHDQIHTAGIHTGAGITDLKQPESQVLPVVPSQPPLEYNS